MTKRTAHNNRVQSLDIDYLITRRAMGDTYRELAEMFNVAPSTISNAIRRKDVKRRSLGEEDVCYRTETIKIRRRRYDSTGTN